MPVPPVKAGVVTRIDQAGGTVTDVMLQPSSGSALKVTVDAKTTYQKTAAGQAGTVNDILVGLLVKVLYWTTRRPGRPA